MKKFPILTNRYKPSHFPNVVHFRSISILYYVCILMGMLFLSSGCGSSFSGVLAPAPAWMKAGAGVWRTQAKQWVFASGHITGVPKILERRSIAQAKATQNLQTMITSKIQRAMRAQSTAQPVSPQESQLVEELLSHLPWAQMSVVEARFFDAEANTQHALVGISWDQFDQAVNRDNSKGTIKSLVKELAQPIFR